jgi:hypothetical protein
LNIDIRQYKLRIFLHAEELMRTFLDDETPFVGFLKNRLEFSQNYYQIEVPLQQCYSEMKSGQR